MTRLEVINQLCFYSEASFSSNRRRKACVFFGRCGETRGVDRQLGGCRWSLCLGRKRFWTPLGESEFSFLFSDFVLYYGVFADMGKPNRMVFHEYVELVAHCINEFKGRDDQPALPDGFADHGSKKH